MRETGRFAPCVSAWGRLSEIRDIYRATLQAVEIGAYLRRIEDEDDEEVLLMLL